MNILKKSLAMFLVLCMFISALPVTALATETDSTNPVVTEPAEETAVEATEVTEETAEAVEETLAPIVGTYAATTFTVKNEIAVASIDTITMGVKPSDGTTTGEPFPQGTGGSNSFRIPALVTLSDGTLVAATDARWNSTLDNGGIDTLVSVSTDNGANWYYSYANYLGDNGNEYNNGSTCFIDPALAVDSNDNIYMLVDLYPYGVAIAGTAQKTASTAVGFNDDGKLLLSGDNHSTYNYYLDGDAIYSSDGTKVEGYTVDEYFNITEESSQTTSNLFFSNSPYKVVRTGYLYLTKGTYNASTKSISWSEPKLIPNVKSTSEYSCLVGPGRGLVTSNGMIVFPVYKYNGTVSDQMMSFIYSLDDGETWSRSSECGVEWSSEAAVVELKDGTLRFFYRNGTAKLCYVDYANDGNWDNAVSTGIPVNSNTQLSAISYSKTVGGKQVILVSCPIGSGSNGSSDNSGNARLNGKIFAFTVGDGNALTLAETITVKSDDAMTVNGEPQFMYSCLTELNNGQIAILNEDGENAWGGGSDSYYYTMSYSTYDLSLTSDDDTSDGDTSDGDTSDGDTDAENSNVTINNTVDVRLAVGETSEPYTDTTGNYEASAEIKDESIATMEVEGVNGTAATGTNLGTNDDVPLTDCLFTFNEIPSDDDNTYYTIKSASVPGAYLNNIMQDTSATEPISATAGKVKITAGYTNMFQFKFNAVTDSTYKGTPSLHFHTELSTPYWNRCSNDTSEKCYEYLYRPVKAGETSSEEIPGFVQITSLDEIVSGEQYLIAHTNGTNYYVLYPGTSQYECVVQVDPDSATTTASTEVTFTGKKAGETTAVVGTTQYNITVYEPRNIIVNYQHNGVTVYTENMTVDSDAATATLPGLVVGPTGTAYQNDTTALTLKDGVANYIVEVTELEALPADVAVNGSATLTQKNLDSLTEGQYVVWTSADTSKVSVAAKYDTDGNYTTSATIIGHAETDEDSPVLVTGIVYNADGTVAYSTKFAVKVTPDEDGDTSEGAGTTKYIYIDIARIQNTTVYYSINGGALIEITEDKLELVEDADNGNYYKLQVPLMDEQYTGGFQISFFAAPEEGYALTYMSSNAVGANQYYTLSDGKAGGVDSDAWPFDPSYTDYDSYTGGRNINIFKYDGAYHGLTWGLSEGNFTVAQMKVMFASAIYNGCDGILVFTKNQDGTTNGSTSNYGNNDLVTTLAFVSQKLPELEKKITSITHSNGTTVAYTEGMTLALTDTINYTITVYEPTTVSEYGSITYSAIELNDPLTGNTWTTKSDVSSTVEYTFTNSATGEEQTVDATAYTYTPTSLTLAVTNLLELVDENGYITNTADLTYQYTSQYSEGYLKATASAAAQAKVEVPEYVIDFGLPVEINLSNNPLIDGYETIVKATAQYGNVTFDGLTVTYTPTKILQGNDFIRLTIADSEGSTNNIGYGIRIYPATTVYYEESFINWGSNWSGGNKPITVGVQAAEQLNTAAQGAATSDEGKQYNYGYDPAYDNTTGASNGTNATTTTIGATGSFKFTGDGIQIFANCSEKSGYVSVEVVNSSGATVALAMVDTIVDPGTTNATNGQTGNLYGLPIVSLIDLQNIPHDTYTVTITKIMDTEPVYIDGIRVFNTMKDSSIFVSDEEDNPDFYELRDCVLHAIGVGKDTSVDYRTMYEQVYDEIAGAAALITDEKVDYGDKDTVQDLLDNGPKNEIYLYANQTLTFKVETERVMQIGLKAPQGATTATISIYDGSNPTTTEQAVGSSVDMFYTLTGKKDSETTYTVQIKNTGDKILSVTELKICDDPGFSFKPLTQEDIEDILLGLYDVLDEEISERVDINGDGSLNAKDATMILRWVVGKLPDVPANFEQIADINGDGTVNAKDATMILRFVVGKVDIPGWEN